MSEKVMVSEDCYTPEWLNMFGEYWVWPKTTGQVSYIPTKVIFNGTTTICHWNDGSKTIVKCADDEKFIPEVGVAEATMKKIYGTRMAFLRVVKNAYVQPEKKIKVKKENKDAL